MFVFLTVFCELVFVIVVPGRIISFPNPDLPVLNEQDMVHAFIKQMQVMTDNQESVFGFQIAGKQGF